MVLSTRLTSTSGQCNPYLSSCLFASPRALYFPCCTFFQKGLLVRFLQRSLLLRDSRPPTSLREVTWAWYFHWIIAMFSTWSIAAAASSIASAFPVCNATRNLLVCELRKTEATHAINDYLCFAPMFLNNSAAMAFVCSCASCSAFLAAIIF